MRTQIKEWWHRHWVRPRARKFYRGLDELRRTEACNFAVTKEGLQKVLKIAEEGGFNKLDRAICCQAGFLSDLAEVDGVDRYLGLYSFLYMAVLFMKNTYGIDVDLVYPFDRIDDLNDNEHWTGPSLEVRIDAMRWIISEIDRWELDKEV